MNILTIKAKALLAAKEIEYTTFNLDESPSYKIAAIIEKHFASEVEKEQSCVINKHSRY